MIVVLRPPLWRRLLLPVGLGALLALGVGFAVRQGGALVIAVLPMTVLAATVAARSWSLRVEARPERLVLVNWLVSVHLPWGQVARCGHDDDGVWVWREDGHEFRPAAFRHGGRAPGFARRPARAAAARLEQIRRRHR